jgi:hypothetical protein
VAACDAPQTILVNCSGCHDGSLPMWGMLDLRSPDSAAPTLVGQPARGTKCAATGAVLINPDGSGLFVDKLRSSPPCGDRMPMDTFSLSDAEIACVEQWTKSIAGGN